MAKIESIAFSFGLAMAGLLVLSTIAPVATQIVPNQGATELAGLAVARAA